jgi:hypothetical protein
VNFVKIEVFVAVELNDIVFWDIKPSSYLTGNTLSLCYRAQPVNAV